ncbi:MAG: glutathione S-transferase [Rhodospirillales bacterium 70-18]|nr:glutathione S-transferase family protein [Rhodospirillales bacterium]OJY68462.1 MAG: glutathione S-transferase [Rhodospirillales bacterium 70-18]
MSLPVLYGAEYSVYTRIARLALLEKGVAHRLDPVDVFAPGGPSAAHLARHPFGRIPVLEHDGFTLYEASAIARYVDEAFPGPALQPAGARGRARMAQVVSLLDSYAFRPLVLEIYVQRVSRRTPDEARIAAALGPAAVVLDSLEILAENHLAGPDFSLADLHFVPILAYFTLAAEGAAMLAARPKLSAWWARMQRRETVLATRFPAEG